MTFILTALLYAAVTTALAPQLLTRGRWQVWRPRLALASWHTAWMTSAAAIAFSFCYAIALAYQHGTSDTNGRALLFSLAAWGGTFTVAAVCALLGGLSEPILRRERGVSQDLRFAAITCPQSVSQHDGVTIRYVETDQPLAYSFHGPEPTIVIGRDLRRELTEPQLQSVIAHERAHLDQRHHLLVGLANLNSSVWPTFGPARRLRSASSFLIELIADDAAQAACGREATASALQVMAQRTGRPELALRAERLQSQRTRLTAVRWASFSSRGSKA